MAPNPEVAHGKSEFCDPAIKCLSQCFYDDPVWTYWLNDRPRAQRIAYHAQLFYHLVKPAALLNSTFIEANDWGSCIILVAPKKRIDNFWVDVRSGWLKCLWNIGMGSAKRLVYDYNGALTEAKKRHMGSERYYYIYLTGTLPSCRRQGLSSALLRECIKIAEKERLPIWMEATSEDSHRLYSKTGFETVEVLKVGKGKCDANGEAKKEGEGISIWAMTWRPAKTDESMENNA